MAEVEFTYYLHDQASGHEMETELVEQEGLPREVAYLIAAERPFYEVALKCVFDTETKKVTVREVRL